MPELERPTPAKVLGFVEVKVVPRPRYVPMYHRRRIREAWTRDARMDAHAPRYDASDPGPPSYYGVGGDPLAVCQAHEVAAVDGECAECGRGTEKKRDKSNDASIGDRKSVV